MIPKAKDVYVVTERDGKPVWKRVGTAYVDTSDGSIRIAFDAPVGVAPLGAPDVGHLEIRERTQPDGAK